MIKLIAIDLDGTLLNDKKEVTPRNKEVLARAKAQGVKIVICTGRPLRAIRPYLEELSLKEPGDYSITFNGGLVQKNETGEIIEKAAMQLADIHELVSVAEDLNLPLDVVSEEIVLSLPTSAAHPSIYGSLNPLLDCRPFAVADLDESMLYNKAVIAYHQEVLDPKIPEISSEIREKYEIIKSRNNLFGDEENDLPMIRYAGIGVAMANAVPIIKEAADVVTLSNQEDGVAAVIEEYVLKGGA